MGVFLWEYSGENMIGLVVERWEAEFLRRSGCWFLVYGRRKVGKTFILRRFLPWDFYVTVSRGGYCIVDGDVVDVEGAVSRVVDVLEKGGAAIIDEFQRLPEHYWDLFARAHPSGRLVLSGSSFGVVDRVLGRRSPLLGLLMPFKLDLISPADSIVSLVERGLSVRDAVLWATLIRDPWLIPFVDFSLPPWVEVSRLAPMLVASASGLIGEVFLEEERQLTRLYDALLRLLASGCWSPKVIAARLYSAGLLSSSSPGIVTGVLSKLEAMGLVEKVGLWRTRGAKFYYRHRSPLTSILLWLDEKFEFEGYTSSGIIDALRSRLAFEAQFFLGELLAKARGFRRGYSILYGEQGDIDIVLLDRRGRAVEGFEVKVGALSSSEVRRAVERIRSLGIPRVGMISLVEKPPMLPGVDEILGPDELLKEAEMLKRKEWSE